MHKCLCTVTFPCHWSVMAEYSSVYRSHVTGRTNNVTLERSRPNVVCV